jgi:hypothetical protein
MRTVAHSIAASLWLGLILLSTASQPAVADDGFLGSYFPIALKNQWVYVLSDGDDRTQEELVQVVGADLVGGKPVFLTSNYHFGFVTDPIQFLTDDLGRTCEHRDGKFGVWYPWMDQAPVAIPSFEIADCLHGTQGTMQRVDEMTVPAGTFRNVFRVVYDWVPCSDAGLVSESFAPGVGLIERQLITFVGVQTWQLSRMFLQGEALWGGALPVSSTTWGNIKNTFAK